MTFVSIVSLIGEIKGKEVILGPFCIFICEALLGGRGGSIISLVDIQS
jgi:hypothetical protein